MKVVRNRYTEYAAYDLRVGVLGQWKWYLPVFILSVVLCIRLLVMHGQAAPRSDGVEAVLTFGDYVFFLLRGMEIFVPGDPGFQINVLWVAVNLYLAYIVSYYPFRDMNGYGQQMLLRSEKRSYWWAGKCLWNIASVLAFYLCIYFTCFLFSLLSGEVALLPQAGIQRLFTQSDVMGLSDSHMLLWGFAMPVLTSVTLSLLQMMISLIWKPVLGIVTVAALLSASIFYCTWWLPGSFLMMTRTTIWQENSDYIVFGLCLLLIVSAASIILAFLYFSRKDIYAHGLLAE